MTDQIKRFVESNNIVCPNMPREIQFWGYKDQLVWFVAYAIKWHRRQSRLNQQDQRIVHQDTSYQKLLQKMSCDPIEEEVGQEIQIYLVKSPTGHAACWAKEDCRLTLSSLWPAISDVFHSNKALDLCPIDVCGYGWTRCLYEPVFKTSITLNPRPYILNPSNRKLCCCFGSRLNVPMP